MMMIMTLMMISTPKQKMCTIPVRKTS